VTVTRINCLAAEKHFVDHLAAVWKAIPPHDRGIFYVRTNDAWHEAIRHRLSPKLWNGRISSGALVLVASLGDLNAAWKVGARTVLMEHGAGQTYNSTHSSYAGGSHPARDACELFLVPGVTPAEKLRNTHPDTPVVEIGCPKLDSFHGFERRRNDIPKVAISFHWDCRVVNETRWAWPTFRNYIAKLVNRPEYEIIGHGHPRAMAHLRPWWQRLEVPVIEDFNQVLKNADVYVIDNSSSMFEAAAVGIPVVVLNAPLYRKNVDHGLRFWDVATIGEQVNNPAMLHNAIMRALKQSDEQKAETERCLDIVYTYRDGDSARRAYDAIRMHVLEKQ
jgi:hypothetical protein